MLTAMTLRRAGRLAGSQSHPSSLSASSEAGAANLRDDGSEDPPTTLSGDRVSMRSADRPAREPRRSRDLRRRLLRHHLPLGTASVAVSVMFMSVPTFDANRYSHADIFSGAFPQQRQRGDAGPTAHGGDQARPMRHGRVQTGPVRHGAGQSGPVGGHERGQTASSERTRTDSFLGLSIRGLTVATGYIATGLLALTLLIGPANLLFRRRNPVSSYLRRDVGTWTAIFSVVHVVFGFQVHERLSDFLNYFVAPDGSPLTNSFGLGNWTGLAALLIVAALLALSSDAALRKLRAKNWKRLQRLNYALFALVVVHAFFYGAAVRSDSPYTLLLLLTVVAIFAGQALGVWLYRRRYARNSRVSVSPRGASRPE
jgi:methionine sulfoxide reductase heme-binding subunit